HVLSSNQERNLLSLMARTQSETFDAQSHLFERDMVAELLSATAPQGTLVRTNIRLTIEGKEEELDVVLVDVSARRLLIGELRWMLGPGDPREILNRQKESLKKVEQIRRKVEWAAHRTPDVVAAALGRPSADIGNGWCTSGVVLLTGYGGTRSPDGRY